MADLSVVNEWIKKADEDFGFAVSVKEDSTFYAQICFHFHQAASIQYPETSIMIHNHSNVLSTNILSFLTNC